MPISVKVPTVLVTGASRGIGSTIARKFASQGFHLILIARDRKALANLKKDLEQEFKIECHIYAADLSNAEGLQQTLTGISAMHKRIDVLVNNAGIYEPGQVSSQSEQELKRMLEVNLFAAWRLSQWAIPLLQKGKKPLIINIGSVAGLNAYPNGGAYSVSKYALNGYTKNLREELKEQGIRVTVINPGATWSSSWEGVRLPKSRLMPAEDIAEACTFCYQLSPSTVVEEMTIRPLLGDVKEEEM